MSFFKKIIRVWLIYNVSLVLGIQQSESVIHIHISTLFRFFSHIGHYRVLSRVPYDKDLLYSTQNSTQYSVMAYMGKETKKSRYMYMYN